MLIKRMIANVYPGTSLFGFFELFKCLDLQNKNDYKTQLFTPVVVGFVEWRQAEIHNMNWNK